MNGLSGFGCDIPGLVMMRRYTTGSTVARRGLGSGMHFFSCWMYIVACWLTSISVLNLSLRSDLFAMFHVLSIVAHDASDRQSMRQPTCESFHHCLPKTL